MTINILYQFDNKYAPYAGVSITSLLDNQKENTKIHIFCAALDDVSNENKNKIESVVNQYQQRITWIETDVAIRKIRDMKCGTWNNSLATWIKFFIFDSIPSSVNRLLYLDCDTIINNDLSDLFTFDLKNYSVAAVMDSVAQCHCERLVVDEYFNAGVILFDMNYIRKMDISTKILKHLRKNVDRYLINDQDLLNDFFKGKIYKLLPRYNLQGFHLIYDNEIYFKVYHYPKYYNMEDIVEAQENTVIYHFFRAFGNYPWEKGNIHPNRILYHTWLNKSLWKGLEDLENNEKLVFKVEKALYRILPKRIFLEIYRRIC